MLTACKVAAAHFLIATQSTCRPLSWVAVDSVGRTPARHAPLTGPTRAERSHCRSVLQCTT